MLDKRQIQAIFLFEFKMGQKAGETTCNINNASGPRTTNNIQCTGGSRRTTGIWQWPVERIIEVDPLITTQEVDKEFNVDHSMVIQYLKQTGKVKTLNK